jgi:hypothetical protein
LQHPRTGNAGRHDLLEMLLVALCTVLCGGEDCTDMAEFARTKLEFLRGFLKLEHGVRATTASAGCSAAGSGAIPRLLPAFRVLLCRGLPGRCGN